MWSAFISIQNNKAITKATWNNRHSTCIFTVAPTDCERGKLCPRRFNNLKFFLLISRCDVCRLTHSGQQPHCVSRTSSLFQQILSLIHLITSVGQSELIKVTVHAAFPFPVWVQLEWSALQPWNNGQQQIIWQLFYIHAFKVSGLRVGPLSSPPVNTPTALSLHFQTLLYVFSSVCAF